MFRCVWSQLIILTGEFNQRYVMCDNVLCSIRLVEKDWTYNFIITTHVDLDLHHELSWQQLLSLCFTFDCIRDQSTQLYNKENNKQIMNEGMRETSKSTTLAAG